MREQVGRRERLVQPAQRALRRASHALRDSVSPVTNSDASAQDTASRIVGAMVVGFDHGGHVWVAHGDEMHAASVEMRLPPVRP